MLLDVELALVSEEARGEVDGVVGPRAGDMDRAARERIDGEGCDGEGGITGGEREVAWESWMFIRGRSMPWT